MRLYFNGEPVNTGSDGISIGEVYSTDDEVRIGTWIDGKPLYMKVIKGVTGGAGSISVVGTVDHIDSLVMLYCIIFTPDERQVILPDFRTVLSVNKDNDIEVNVPTSSHTFFAYRPITSVIKYTKTTD